MVSATMCGSSPSLSSNACSAAAVFVTLILQAFTAVRSEDFTHESSFLMVDYFIIQKLLSLFTSIALVTMDCL